MSGWLATGSTGTGGIYNRRAVRAHMTTSATTDERVGVPVALGAVAVFAAVGMAVFGLSGDQVAAGSSFAVAMVAGTLAVAAAHAYG